MTRMLRAIALAIAAAAVVDPTIAVNRARPIPVAFATDGSRLAADVRQQIVSLMGGRVLAARGMTARAVVSLGGVIDPESIAGGVTVSSVSLSKAPNVTLVNARLKSILVPGLEGTIDVDVFASGLTGRSSVMTVTQNGVEIGRSEHKWSDQRRSIVAVPFVPVAAGVEVVKVEAVPLEAETRDDDNALTVAVTTIDRPLKVAVLESRPSWAAAFVRRALESDRTFAVSSLTRTSRGVVVRTDDAPTALTASALERFDVILAGAPEDLSRADLGALRTFMEERGGTVVFLPDRRPSGAYASLVSASGFDEILLNGPVTLRSSEGEALRASELAIPRNPSAAMRPLASSADGRAAVTTWAVGEGSGLYSSALDAWRFRAQDDERFSTAWRSWIAAAAIAAPPPLDVSVDPETVRRRKGIKVVARVRRTELERDADGTTSVPGIVAAAVSVSGSAEPTEPVRLWPSAAPGVFEGHFTPANAGAYDIHVSAGRTENAARALELVPEPSIRADDEEVAAVARSTGGVVTTAENLTPLLEHLESLQRDEFSDRRHPMRSGWWTLPFASVLCLEWMWRRRRGER